jgi:hypothetical protein
MTRLFEMTVSYYEIVSIVLDIEYWYMFQTIYKTDQRDKWQSGILSGVNKEMWDKEGDGGETIGSKGKIEGYGRGDHYHNTTEECTSQMEVLQVTSGRSSNHQGSPGACLSSALATYSSLKKTYNLIPCNISPSTLRHQLLGILCNIMNYH